MVETHDIDDRFPMQVKMYPDPVDVIAYVESRCPEWFVVPGEHGGCYQRTYMQLAPGWFAEPKRYEVHDD